MVLQTIRRPPTTVHKSSGAWDCYQLHQPAMTDAVGFEPTSYGFGDRRVTVTPDTYIMDVVGLEPTTFGLRDRYSNHLSYTSIT